MERLIGLSLTGLDDGYYLSGENSLFLRFQNSLASFERRARLP